MQESTTTNMPKTKPNNTSSQNSHSMKPIWVLVIIALLLIIGGGAWFIKNHLAIHATIGKTQTLQTQTTALTEQVNSQKATIEQLKDSLTAQTSLANKQSDTVFALQIYYLIKTADFYLTVDKNVPLALKNLTLANNLTTKITSSPSIDKLKVALNSDIITLQNNKTLDKNSIITDIENLANALEQLKKSSKISTLATLDKQQKATQATPTTSAQSDAIPLPVWRKILSSITLAFKEAVIIRHSDIKNQPLLTREQAIIALTAMQCRLLLAQTALLNNQFTLFTNQIIAVNNAFQSYFSQYPNKTFTSIYQQLATLETSDFSKKLPSLQLSEQAIEAIIKSLP